MKMRAIVAAVVVAACCGMAWGQVAWRVGGSENDYGKDITVDPAGNVIVAGYFGGTADLDPGPAERQFSAGGVCDMFLAKYEPDGRLLWAQSIGGRGADMPHTVLCDAEGNIYATGYFSGGADFDPGPGTAMLRSAGKRDVFVAKFSADGKYLWAVGFGSEEDDEGMDLTVARDGTVYVVGVLEGSAKVGGQTLEARGGQDGFVACFDANGKLQSAFLIGGSGDDQVDAVEVDGRGGIHVLGFFSGSVAFGDQRRSSNGGRDMFLAGYDGRGQVRYLSTFGGAQEDFAAPGGIAVDQSGDVYFTGRAQGRWSVAGLPEIRSAGMDDVVVARCTSDGKPVYVRVMGGPGGDGGHRIGVDEKGNVYVAGWFRDAMNLGSVQLRGNGQNGSDAFAACWGADGKLRWAHAIGGPVPAQTASMRVPPGNILAGMAVDASGGCWVTGRFYGTAALLPRGQARMSSAGGSDVLVASLP